ncbi:MAG: CDP-glycerol glycerophosphotransferase family protein [Patescibacteria group bacterium]|nr:CDP-glycerol glycerophosphotransferase family protein [Patescibacteria group bacterium]
MKKIFMTLSRGFLARNILQTGISAKLLEEGNELVIATPGVDDPEFVKTFSRPDVKIIKFHIPRWTWLDRRLAGFHHNLLWSGTVRFAAKYGIYKSGRFQSLRYVVQLLVFKPLSYIPQLRLLVRWFDSRLRPAPQEILEQLRKEKPELVFLTNPMEDADSFYIKAAKQLGITTVGLVKSWDNMSKTSFRILTDYVLVWGEYMKEEAVKYQLYPKDRIFETGVPQFDIYFSRDGLRQRDEFLDTLGLEPRRKTIIFGSEGKVTPNDSEVAAGIVGMMEKGELIKPCQVLVRPHFGYKNDADKFDPVAGKAHLAIDRFNTPRPVFYDQWDFSREHYLRLAEILQAGDIMVTTASTLAIDAVMFDVPVIAVAFDGDHMFPHRESVARWYETEYYSHVLKTGAVVIVRNFTELRAALNAALARPGARQAQRRELVRRFAGRYDGKAAGRIAAYLSELAATGKISKEL